jgi:hypothetical protein
MVSGCRNHKWQTTPDKTTSNVALSHHVIGIAAVTIPRMMPMYVSILDESSAFFSVGIMVHFTTIAA